MCGSSQYSAKSNSSAEYNYSGVGNSIQYRGFYCNTPAHSKPNKSILQLVITT